MPSNWRDVRADAIAAGLIDEQAVSDAMTKLAHDVAAWDHEWAGDDG